MTAIPVNVSVQNQFPSTAKSIQMFHQFRSNDPQSYTWNNVPGNGSVTPSTQIFVAEGSTGVGRDWWNIIVTLTNGQVWEYLDWKTCTIHSDDANTYQTHVVKPDYWYIALVDGCTTSLETSAGSVVVGDRKPARMKSSRPQASA